MRDVVFFSKHLFSPREGHLNAVYNIFRYLQNNLSNNPGRITFDAACVPIYGKVFNGSTQELEDWKVFYPDAEKDYPRNKLKLLR